MEQVGKMRSGVDVPSSSGKSSSTNRFEILSSTISNEELENEMENEDYMGEDVLIEPKKVRAIAAGVAELMKPLKPRRKGPIDKGKYKQAKVGATALGGISL